MSRTTDLTSLDRSTIALDGARVEDLSARLHGELIRPGDDGYDDARRLFNGIHDKRPGLIARCTGAADVRDSVDFAREHEVLLSIRGGGHNVAGTSSCEGGLMIDLSRLRSVRVDPDRRIADVGPGATWGDVDRETQAFGLVAPGGVVSTTGVAGLTLGGGLGWVRRKYGMTIDSLLAVDMVTADGDFVRASEEENQDLFWAVRGGGGNFGVVTSFRFRLHPLGPEIYLAAPMYPAEEAREILPRWRDFCETLDDETSGFAMFQTLPPADAFPEEARNQEVLALPAMYAGPVEEGQRVLQPLRELGTPVLDLSAVMPFEQLQQAFDWLFPWGGRYYWKTATIPALDEEAIDAIVGVGDSRSSPRTISAIWQMGGAMSRIPPEDTAYGSRDAPWLLDCDSFWTDPEEDETHIRYTREAWERMSARSDGGMYLHYGVLEPQDRIRQAYGDNYDRLVEIKRRWDPHNLFRMNQNISPEDGTEVRG
ncbi:MAG TPA: FAD-binding oxidoreductase [Longimicrobiales bacterium]|nr:FAD-binding oxidoreductase [Longimicrobiales bacterium]